MAEASPRINSMMQKTAVIPDLKVAQDLPKPTEPLDPAIVLEELFTLLEDYAPVWYHREHHDRAVAAILGKEL
jgi:hypothetical protein